MAGAVEHLSVLRVRCDDLIINITDAEIQRLEECRTADDWNDACDAVKRARGGQYPPDWWQRVRLTGMMDRILRRFGASSDIQIL